MGVSLRYPCLSLVDKEMRLIHETLVYSPITFISATRSVAYLWLVLAIIAPRLGMAQTQLLEAIAKQGDAVTQLTLGKMYLEGKEVTQDLVQAHAWLSLSAEQGNKEAAHAREQILGLMTTTQIAEAQQLARTWKPATSETSKTAASKDLIADVQGLLTELGYQPGPVDGVMGRKTRVAIMKFQTDSGLPSDGEPTLILRNQLAAKDKGKATPTTELTTTTRWPTPQRGVLRAATALKSTPSRSAGNVRELAADTQLLVVGKKGSWYQVEVATSADEGWVKFTSVQLLPKTGTQTNLSAGTTTQTEANNSGGFLAGIARSVTGLVGITDDQPATMNSGNATIGIRGLTSGDLSGARPNRAEFEKLNRLVVSNAEAMQFANETNLVQLTIAYLPEPVRVHTKSTSQTSER